MDYLGFILTHKNNLINNIRLGKKGRLWYKQVSDEFCQKNIDCNECLIALWCQGDNSSFYRWTHTWQYILISISNILENRLWSWYKNHPGKKIYTCSICGLRERGSRYYLITYAGWRKEHHKWVCHHCWGHPNDDINYDTLENISHEDYEKQWENYVKEHNKGV